MKMFSQNRLWMNGQQTKRRFFRVALGLLSLTLMILWASTPIYAQEERVTIIGTVTSMPEDESGIGEWSIVDLLDVAHTVLATEDTIFFPNKPTIDAEIILIGYVNEDSEFIVFEMYGVQDEEQIRDEDPEDRWFILVGMVKERPEDANGLGEWVIEDLEGQTHELLVDRTEVFLSSIPIVSEIILVSGFGLPDGSIIVDEVERFDGETEGDQEPDGEEIFEISGIVLSSPSETEGEPDLDESQRWTIRTSDGVVIVETNEDVSYYPEEPTIGQAVRVLAYKRSDDALVAIEIAHHTFEGGDLVVRLHSGVSIETITSRYKVSLESTLLNSANIHRLRSPNPRGAYMISTAEKLAEDSDVIWAELNFIGTIPVQGHPHLTWGWSVENNDQYVNQGATEQIQLPTNRSQLLGDGVIIAILDTGVDLDHPALASRLLSGRDMIDDDAIPEDEPGFAQGHGTHVAGIAAQIAPGSQILPVRVLDSDGRGDAFILAYAIEWAVEQGADVINMSLGTADYSHVLHDTILAAVEEGVVFVAAAGNSADSAVNYPASFSEVIAVTAVDEDGVKASFANFGSWIDLAAPGVGIRSSVVLNDESSYAALSGTSMSAPFVSGAAALVRQQSPTNTSTNITDTLRQNGSDLDALNPSFQGQVGRLLNVASSLGQTCEADCALNVKFHLPIIMH